MNPKKNALALAYRDYVSACRNQSLLDFHDLLFEMRETLCFNEGVRARWQYRQVTGGSAAVHLTTLWESVKNVPNLVYSAAGGKICYRWGRRCASSTS